MDVVFSLSIGVVVDEESVVLESLVIEGGVVQVGCVIWQYNFSFSVDAGIRRRSASVVVVERDLRGKACDSGKGGDISAAVDDFEGWGN